MLHEQLAGILDSLPPREARILQLRYGLLDGQYLTLNEVGQKMGVTGTPSFVLGLTDPEDPSKVKLSKFIRGAQALPAFVAAIDELLETHKAE